MALPADFGDAHVRHWEDAELLLREDRWANADQAYGFSAECGLKALAASGGLPVDASGKPKDPGHRKHIDGFWAVFPTFVEGRIRAPYVTDLPAGTPFADWSVHDRYAHRCHFLPETVETHRTAALEVRRMVRRARQDGVL